MCFVWIWEQTAIISLYSINWLVFITEMKSVYCAVRAEFQASLQEETIIYPTLPDSERALSFGKFSGFAHMSW